MSRTSDITSDVTDDGDRTPDSAEEDTFIEAPCREAARYIVACPRCGGQLQLKTLRYSHVCHRTSGSLTRLRQISPNQSLPHTAATEQLRPFAQALNGFLDKGALTIRGARAKMRGVPGFSDAMTEAKVTASARSRGLFGYFQQCS